jgi:hypothetical protein
MTMKELSHVNFTPNSQYPPKGPSSKYPNAGIIVWYDDAYYKPPVQKAVPNPGTSGGPPKTVGNTEVPWLVNFDIEQCSNDITPPDGSLQIQINGIPDKVSVSAYFSKNDGTGKLLGTNDNTKRYNIPPGDPSVGIT